MRTFLRKYFTPAVMLIVMAAVLVSMALADQPGRRRSRGPIRSVAEPATIVLLGAGLASLGYYAFKKRKK